MKYLVVLFFLVCLIFSCGVFGKKNNTKEYSLNDTYYLETTTQGNGYSWILLCNRKTQICLNIYPEIHHYNPIDKIVVKEVVNDTAIYEVFFQGQKHCTYQQDTVIMSEFKLISRSVEKNCQ